MSRGFTENEKQTITNSLINQGKMLFSTYGFKKTTIQYITNNVEIAQGIFYNFFNSKEELYFIILETEEKELRERFSDINLSNEKHPKETIKKVLKEMIHIIELNPFIRELYFSNTMDHIINKLSPQLLENHFKKDTSSLFPFIHQLQEAGFALNKSPEVVAGVLRSLFLLTFHQKEIGETVYEETVEFYIDLVVDGLLVERS